MRSPGRGGETKNPKYGHKAPARASVSETDKKFNLIKTITTMKYLIRSVKYFIALCVLYLIIMALMLLTNTSVLTPSETFSALVHSTRGQVLIVAVVLLSALYSQVRLHPPAGDRQPAQEPRTDPQCLRFGGLQAGPGIRTRNGVPGRLPLQAAHAPFRR